MKALSNKILSMPVAAQLLLTTSIVSLLFAFIMQYGFAYEPCILCLWERAPYGATVALAIASLAWQPYGRQTAVLLGLCACIYLTGMGLAFFHTGVELHWWVGTAACSVQPLTGATADDLRESLLRTVAPHCDEIAWSFMGLSMTNMNVIWSLLLALFATIAAAKQTQKL
jgi:disulfide bond formation protein DsbB